MSGRETDTDALIERAADGDVRAVGQLLDRHRGRLRQMVAVRIDPRLSARMDPSDVVQEALAEASRKLPEYLRDRPLPFYPWLRQITWERLVHCHYQHVESQRRSIEREERPKLTLPDQSAMQLAVRLTMKGTSPSGSLIRKELRERVRSALDRMEPNDREVLVMRHLEQLSFDEIAAVLELSESGVKSRHRRALERLVHILQDDNREG